jgi:hypothetical protein
MVAQNGLNGQKTEQGSMTTDIRDERGRFAPGNPGGPGRPRRSIEREYLATLGETVTLADWKEVVARAVADAKGGDQAARSWLAKYLIGANPRTLLDIAADEELGFTPEDDIRIEATSSTADDDDWSDIEDSDIDEDVDDEDWS